MNVTYSNVRCIRTFGTCFIQLFKCLLLFMFTNIIDTKLDKKDQLPVINEVSLL